MTIFQLPLAIQTHVIKSPGVTIYYPSVIHFNNQKAQQKMNQTIYSLVHDLIEEQKQYQSGSHPEVVGHYEIKTNERGILSLTLSNYTYTYPMAHGFTLVRSLTFDATTGKSYTLQELFKPNSDYINILSHFVAKQIKERNIQLLDGFHTIRPDQDFYLADKTIVLYFQLYEITPYYVGFPMFPIPIYELQDIIPDNGPLSVLLTDIV